jgi:hypothetical protein
MGEPSKYRREWRMWTEGKTYREIGDAFGYSRMTAFRHVCIARDSICASVDDMVEDMRVKYGQDLTGFLSAVSALLFKFEHGVRT